MNPFIRGIKTIQQVGLTPVLQAALYRFGLLTGHYRRLTPIGGLKFTKGSIGWIPGFQSLSDSPLAEYYSNHPDAVESCRKEAEIILAGKCRIFGDQWVDIFHDDLDTSRHWTDFERGKARLPERDIKFIWEPARLGWVFSLARMQAAGIDPDLGRRSWQLLKKFLEQNTGNAGPNWMNGQEVALRILALVFYHEVFRDETDLPATWEQILAQAVIDHARRIPPTLVYARSQRNNHLLVEAAGLYTAGVFLPEHSESAGWKKSGWELFHQALNDQIQDDGTYAQYSTNYHRLMLQIALWVKALGLRAGDTFPESSMQKLAAATGWLADLTAPQTGRVPNYGHNDGAYILPLTGCEFHDYRPVIQSARQFFQSAKLKTTDEMPLWFAWLADNQVGSDAPTKSIPPVRSYRKLVEGEATAFMFSPQFDRRPGQADLHHVELWGKGEPLLLDAGTYQYNADLPWQNALAHTRVHNTLTVNRADQMQRAGRFLWLDWPQVNWIENPSAPDRMSASHDGYRCFGVTHERTVHAHGEKRWSVVDRLIPLKPGVKPVIEICLHWLFPGSSWQILPDGCLTLTDLLQIRPGQTTDADGRLIEPEYQLIQAGEVISASPGWTVPDDDSINLGWYSPTYGKKVPALSYRLMHCGRVPITILTEFIVC